MTEHKTKDGLLTDAELATYGIPPKQQVEPTLNEKLKDSGEKKGQR
jgi:hypothetical protein